VQCTRSLSNCPVDFGVITSKVMGVSAPTPPRPRTAEDPLEDFLCFDLYAASRAITGVHRHTLQPLGLTYPQFLVLVLLWRRGSLTVREIIEKLQLDYGTVSPLLKRLESRGLLSRNRRPDDERTVEITLTDEGRAMEQHTAAIPGILADAFGLDEQDAAQFKRMLGQVRSAASVKSAELAELS
jgi:DNA-binding MarR family transcriptional regulator